MTEQPAEGERTPWLFRILVGAAAVYLVVRFVEIVVWVGDRIS